MEIRVEEGGRNSRPSGRRLIGRLRRKYAGEGGTGILPNPGCEEDVPKSRCLKSKYNLNSNKRESNILIYEDLMLTTVHFR